MIVTAALAASLALGLSPMTVVTLNVHGSVDRNGDGNAGRYGAMRADVLRLVGKYHPDVIALQELCSRQHRGIRAALKPLGYAATMTVSRKSGGCNDQAGGNGFGNALYIKGAISWRASHALPWGKNAPGTPGREPRRFVCATRKDWQQIVCTAHLAPRDPDRANQAAEVRRVALKWANGRPYILAGDMNMGGAGVQAVFGMPVAGSGIDWVTAPSVAFVAAASVPSSDHPAIVATAP